MATAVLMPKLGLTMTEGSVVAWRKKEGETVAKGEILLEVETDKLTNEVEAPASGVLLKIFIGEGEIVPIQTVVGYIGQEGEEVPEPKAPGAASGEAGAPASGSAGGSGTSAGLDNTAGDTSAKRVSASPVARKLAKENNLDLSLVAGTGPAGRVQKEDVEKYLSDAKGSPGAGADTPGQERKASSPGSSGGQSTETRPMTPMRRTISRRLSESWRDRVHVTEFREMDLTEILRLRREYNDRTGIKCSVTDFLLFLTARALRLFPSINVSLENDSITYNGPIHIGLAVSVDDGLLVPVIRNADSLSFPDLHREIQDQAKKAREGRLSGKDLTGGTFTITNLGMLGIDCFTPIINPPESAILGIGRTVDKPMYKGDNIERRSMAWFSLSFDHRVIDGALAAQFLGELETLLTTPALAVWNGTND
jgi:pyruvate dehydrogenase E2 component (dihydrolipoamide acetyltransferase)